MSLIARRSRTAPLEGRDYTGGTFSIGAMNPFGPPGWAIPTNGQTALVDGGGYFSSQQAMKYWPVYACTRIIADMVSGLPADAYTGTVGMKLGAAKRVDPKPTLLTSPSAYASWLQWVDQVVMSLLLTGNAGGMKSSVDRLGYPTQIDIVDCSKVKFDKSDGSAVNTVTGRRIPSGQVTYKVGSSTLTADEFWHLPGPRLPGEISGMSPISYASRLVGLGSAAQTFGEDFFTNGIHPTAVATTDQVINSDQAQQIKTTLKQAVAGRDFPVLGAGVNLKPWQVTPSDSMLIEVQKLNAVAIAQIYGIPPDMIGVSERGSTVTYVNREQRAKELLDNTLAPWIARLEDGLSALFPRTTFVKFDTNVLLRNDMKTRFESYQLALGGPNGTAVPFMDVDEVRDFEDWPPMPKQPEPAAVAPVPGQIPEAQPAAAQASPAKVAT